MLYLLMAIMSSSLIAIIFKYTENNKGNRLVVTSGNYFTAVLISFLINYNKNGELLSKINFNLVMFAVISGFIYFITFILYQKSIKNYGASLAGLFMKLGIFIPMFFSMILWKEYPNFFQSLAMLGAIISIFIINYNKSILNLKEFKILLIFLFLAGGFCDFTGKIFQKYGDISTKESFLTMLFFSSFISSLFYASTKVDKIYIKDILIGILVGIPNLFSSFFLILALSYIKASIVFPFYSVGSLILIIIVSSIFFKEKIKKKDSYAIFISFISLILINL